MPQTDRRRARPTWSSRRISQTQMPAIRRLVRQCCNFDNGYCLALDEGDGCACVQSYSCSLLCKWFREAVLPLDPVLEASLLGGTTKRCAICGETFVPGSNRAKYCPACSREQRRKADAARYRKSTNCAVIRCDQKENGSPA